MPLTSYIRFRLLWGAVDWQNGTGNPYSAAQTASAPSAAAGSGGIGVRRVVATIDRTGILVGSDPAEVHFDFLNFTSGAPDDTWITSDYTTLEGYLNTFFNAVKIYGLSGSKVTQYAWYRVGSGVTSPNPAERTLVLGTPISMTGTAGPLPPQAACSITFRTAVRKSWGRTYLPIGGATLNGDETIPTATVDAIANATNALVTSAAGSDFALVVTSLHLNASLNVEHVEVDNLVDVIRRRRWKSATYKKII